ncbi:MAG: hypothetical protein GF353_02835 [Candidatus Lokiarchaeota archaeon]|nr:hypothetical protein [Candidatus Lokiarchaeota archaeon]
MLGSTFVPWTAFTISFTDTSALRFRLSNRNCLSGSRMLRYSNVRRLPTIFSQETEYTRPEASVSMDD